MRRHTCAANAANDAYSTDATDNTAANCAPELYVLPYACATNANEPATAANAFADDDRLVDSGVSLARLRRVCRLCGWRFWWRWRWYDGI